MFSRQRVPRAFVRAAVVLAVVAATSADVEAQIAPTRVDTTSDGEVARNRPAIRTRFIVAPYGWMSGISGETGVRDLSADVDVSFGNLLDHLRFAAMGTFEVGYDRWLGVVDGMYISVQVDRTASLGPGQQDLTAKSKTFIGEAFGGYSIVPASDLIVDILAGARFWSVEASLNVVGSNASAERSRNPTWTDAVIGARLRWAASERWNVSGGGDGGGGGPRGSKGTAQAYATAGYELSELWEVFGSYRYLYLNYARNEYFFKGHLGGPLIGAAYRW